MPMISSLLNTIALQAKPKGILAQKKSGQSLTQRNYVKSESELSFPNLKNNLNAEKYTFEVNASGGGNANRIISRINKITKAPGPHVGIFQLKTAAGHVFVAGAREGERGGPRCPLKRFPHLF